jgi:hypothetical protein
MTIDGEAAVGAELLAQEHEEFRQARHHRRRVVDPEADLERLRP